MKDEYIDTDGYDPQNPPPLTVQPARKPRSADVEENVEYAAIPRVDDYEGFHRALNMSDMIRLDADIYEWLLSGGLDYENRANAILRRQMILERGLIPPDI